MGKMLRNHLEKGQGDELKMFYSGIPKVQFCSMCLMRNVEARFNPQRKAETWQQRQTLAAIRVFSFVARTAGTCFDPDFQQSSPGS